MADLTKTEEGRKQSEQIEARHKAATGVQAPLDYGPNGVPRVRGAGTNYSEIKPTPDVNDLRNSLDYDLDDHVAAVEAGKASPAPSPSELRATLESLAKVDNQREFRRQLNVQAVRLGDDAEALKKIRERMTELQPNHAPSQEKMAAMIDEVVSRTEEAEWAAED